MIIFVIIFIFLENARFSKICDEHKIKFIGATAEMIERMGDKASAIATMKEAGVPTIPGF
jgi:acetyl-CoA carboxylase biotin carboxylase subunit